MSIEKEEGGAVYELWVKGRLGMHQDKLVLYSVHSTFLEAQLVMHRLLKRGTFATIVRKEVKNAV